MTISDKQMREDLSTCVPEQSGLELDDIDFSLDSLGLASPYSRKKIEGKREIGRINAA